MKRVFSMLLCLLMCVSVFSGTAAEVKALETAYPLLVESSGFSNERITYKISLAPNQTKLSGAIVKVEFDKNVLEVSSFSGAAGKNVDDDYVLNVNGIYEKGLVHNEEGVYSFAFMNPNGFSTGDNSVEFLEIILTAVGETRPETAVKIYCDEYITEDSDDTNDIPKDNDPVLLFEESFETLGAAINKEVASTETGLRFSWIGVVGAEYYDIYRKNLAGENVEAADWELLETVAGNVTEYEDNSIVKGIEYYYSVQTRNEYTTRAYNESGIPGLNFGTITEISADEVTASGIIVSWGALNGADSYEVYRKTADDKAWIKIGSTQNTSYESTNLASGTTYYYTVKALKDKYVAETSVDPASCMFISVPEVGFVQINYSDVVINWSMIKGANSYRVFRKGPADSEYKEVAVVEGNAYEDNDVVTGETYSYKIQAIGAEVESAIAEDGYKVTKLPITDSVIATLGVKKITVSWDPVELAESYIIYRKKGNSGYQPYATVEADENKFDDTSVNSGYEYSYAVATEADGVVTEMSVASETILFLDAPVIVGVKNGSAGMEIEFNAVAGAEKYIVYRKTAGASFSEIGEVYAGEETVYVDESAASGVQYIYGICAISGETTSPRCESNLACRLSEPKITGFTRGYGGIAVKWGAVKGAEKYVVWYRAPGDDGLKILATVDASTLSYTHASPKSGRYNFYAIQAVCGDIESTMSEDYTYYIGAPKVNYIANATKYVTIRWAKVENVESYRVYRKLKGASSWTIIANITADKNTSTYTYKDTSVSSGKDYVYTVRAYDGDEWSPYNKTGWGIRFLATPTLKSAASAYGGLKVTWSKVAGASKYIVYRRMYNSSSKTWSGWTNLGSTKSTSYVDKTAKSNNKYNYTIRACYDKVTSYFNTSGISCSYIATPVAKVANASSGVKISWAKIGGANKYVVYRKAGKAKSWSKIATTTSTTYVDKKVKNKTAYVYTVRAYKNSLASGYNTSGVKTVFLTTPKMGTPVSAKAGITVKWSAVSGVSGYIIYRKTGSGSYTKLATIKGASKKSYVDKTAKKGVTYTYAVKSYYGSYTSSYQSKAIKDKY